MNLAKPPWYVTTAIPYVNAPPHLGFAHEIIQADVLARYHRLCGYDVHFLTGTDENSLKNARAAQQLRVPPHVLIAKNARSFQALQPALDLSCDDFIRTSVDIRHRAGVLELWRACARSGDIYKGTYKGLYCVGCEHFCREGDLENGLCAEHLVKPELVCEENYFFRLSRYTEQLSSLVLSGELRITPDERRNEVLRWLESGLDDISISRSRQRAGGLGIPVPGDPGQVVYVWFDALANYISALGYGGDDTLFERYWDANPNRTHVVGKGVTRFHAIYWPALLLSAGINLPTQLFVHGYVTVEGEKISKSLGNAVDPLTLAGEVGADALRFYLLRHIRSSQDGDFSRARLDEAYLCELANGLGNLLSRTLGLINRYAQGTVPEPAGFVAVDQQLIDLCIELPAKVDTAFRQFRVDLAIGALWGVIQHANRYVSEVAPWRIAGGGLSSRVRTCVFVLAETLRIIGVFVEVFLPASGRLLLCQLGANSDAANFNTQVSFGRALCSRPIAGGDALFPRQC